ncbi:MAG: hypothetical protein M3Y54_08685 [Bacteroidota bacterium]|nr:hypothetical protein [Bacteroidota bacterium]
MDRSNAPKTCLIAAFAPYRLALIGLLGETESTQFRLYGSYKADSGQYAGQYHQFELRRVAGQP